MTTTDRKPVHVAVAIGLTTGIYAASLAAVTALQANHDRAMAAGRAPVAAAMESLGDANDRLTRGVDASVASYEAAATGYRALTDDLAALESRLADLGGAVGAVRGSMAALPSRVALPSVGRVASRSTASRTQATTGASGAP